jgi:hypothetical protein
MRKFLVAGVILLLVSSAIFFVKFSNKSQNVSEKIPVVQETSLTSGSVERGELITLTSEMPCKAPSCRFVLLNQDKRGWICPAV